MEKNIFDTLPNDFKEKEVANPETGEVVVRQQKQVEVKKDKESFSQRFLNQVVEYANTSGEQLSQKTKDFALDIITMASKNIAQSGGEYNWSDIDVAGNGFVGQIKKWAKLGVGQSDNLYIDIRKNNKTNKRDITIKAQYQTLEKLMVLYYDKKIVRFKTEVICIGDEVDTSEDFETGLIKVTNHKRNENIDRNNYDNITGAYKIMYFYENNALHQLVVFVDKNRINRAYNASASKEKTVWKMDTQKMVKKTVTWEMWNNENVRPFMIFPDDITKYGDQNIITESENMNWDSEKKYDSVESASADIKSGIAKGQAINVPFEE